MLNVLCEDSSVIGFESTLCSIILNLSRKALMRLNGALPPWLSASERAVLRSSE